MKKRQLSVMAFCAVAALGVGLYACDDDAGSDSARKAKEGQSCASMDCESGLECSADKICIDPSKVSEDKAQFGDDCGADKACADGLECGADGKCVEKSGPADEKAKLGEDCGAEKACADGLECGAEGKCVEKNVGPGPKEDPCEGVNCPDGRMCLNAKCYDPECIVDGAEMACDSGKMCSKGECVDDGCQDKACGEGEVCAKGVCEDAICLEKAIVCNDGSTCVKGACIENECLGQTCDAGLTCSKGACVYPACVGKPACDPGKSCNESGECVFENAPALSAEADTVETDENGASATISLSLNNPPAKDVTVKCELSPEGAAAEAEVSCEGVLFDAQNYGDVQTIHVVGLSDNKIDEDQKYTLTITTVSEDALFDGLSQSIEMVNRNVDTVGVSVYTGAEMLTTTESGGSAVFTVVLKAKPEADVTFEVSSSNADYGRIDGTEDNKLVVTFTPENWDTPQEIKVVGVEDGENKNDADHTYQVVFSKTSSEDANYNGLDIAPIDAVNLDNDIAEAFLDKAEVVTEEGGAPVDIMLRLGLAPTDDVNVRAQIFEADGKTESDEVKLLTEQKFAITKDNYKEGVAISLQGIDDHIIDGDQDFKIRLKFSTLDDQYNLEDKWITGKNIDKNVAALTKEYTETKVSEDGTTLDIDLSLSSIPTAPVTVALASSDKAEMTVKPASMTFTPEDWDKPQKITVTGMDDVIVDGDIVSDLTLKVTSDDKNFGGDPENDALNAIEDKIEITTLDNDTAAIVVIAEGAEVLENSGKKLEFKVVLSAQPEAPVTVSAKSNDESELKIVGQPTLIFTEENWNVAQTVFLEVVDDGYADGTQKVHIDLGSTSDDANFNGLKAVSPEYSILDNESATITLTLGKNVLVPGDYSTTVSVALSAPPLSDVVVTLSSSNNDTAALGNSKLTFTTENWDKPQSVTLTDVNPQKAPSAKSTATISAVAAGEGQYNGLKSSVGITLYAFKEKSFAYTGGLQEIALLPGKYKLEVYGSQSTAGWKDGIVGKGGYSTGIYQLAAAKTLYVCVGGNAYHEATASGGYNGGGFGHGKSGGARGGGATHIAISKVGNGTLKAYASNKSDVLIVAGGAGGVEWGGTGGAGGGASGGKGTSVNNGVNGTAAVATPGTQSAGGTSVPMPNMASVMTNGGFGYGGYGYTNSGTDYGAGGGGGWYGGGGTSYAGAAGGGSGYIGGVTSGSMQTGVNANVGSAKITLLD